MISETAYFTKLHKVVTAYRRGEIVKGEFLEQIDALWFEVNQFAKNRGSETAQDGRS
jgi:hypothetical protein